MTDPPPDPDVTLDEWIAASQSCCGADPPDDDPPEPAPEPEEA